MAQRIYTSSTLDNIDRMLIKVSIPITLQITTRGFAPTYLCHQLLLPVFPFFNFDI